MPDLNDRINALVGVLTERTQMGQFEWQKTGEPTTFSAVLPSGDSVLIYSEASGGYPYIFTLFDAGGEVVEQIQTLGPEDAVGRWDIQLRALYVAARAKALDIDGAVNRMLEGFGVDPNAVGPMDANDEMPF